MLAHKPQASRSGRCSARRSCWRARFWRQNRPWLGHHLSCRLRGLVQFSRLCRAARGLVMLDVWTWMEPKPVRPRNLWRNRALDIRPQHDGTM